MQKPSLAKRLFKVGFYALLITLPLVVWLNRFTIHDWVRLQNYTPSAEIAALTDSTTMTPPAKRVFYANHPRIENKDQLRVDCQQNEFTIVLGCYVSGQGIYLFNVDDPRLSGIEEVTAAHEMLHASYDRLSAKEKARINELLEQTFATVENQRIRSTIEQYRQKDPSVVPNELHSILGTEYRYLSPELEEHYAQYFEDRLTVVAFSEKYENEFTSRQVQVHEYDSQLEAFKAQIETNNNRLANMGENIRVQREQLNALLQQDPAAYNAAVPGFNRLVNAYNSLADETQRIIDQHNEAVSLRNAVALEINSLSQAIDTRPQGIPTQ